MNKHLLWLVAMFLSICASVPTWAQNFPSNYCTWYAAKRFNETAPLPKCDWQGNAQDWVRTAGVHWKTTTNPQDPALVTGSVVVWSGGTYGHVAYVTNVHSDGSGIDIAEMNYGLTTKGKGQPNYYGSFETDAQLQYRKDNVMTDNFGNPTTTSLSWASVRNRTASLAFAGYILPRLKGNRAKSGDYDGDGKTDMATWRPSTGTWFILPSSGSGGYAMGLGQQGDIPVPGDYDGDGKTDMAVWRPSEGKWYIQSTSRGGYSVGFGNPRDIPVPSDYDGDGKTDLAVFRPSEGKWYIIYSSNGGGTSVGFGNSGDIPVPSDYDGDGKTDIAIFRPSEGKWYIILSGGGTRVQGFGNPGDIPVLGDYDGDGKTDMAVFRPSEGKWYILWSSGGGSCVGFGNLGDIAVPGDYDGDGKTDIGVWRPSEGKWYIILSGGGTRVQGFGQAGDVPVPGYLIR